MKNKVSDSHYSAKSSKYSVEYYTPPEILEPVMSAFNCRPVLDPASNEVANRFIQANKYLTEEDDGTTQDWNQYLLPNHNNYVWVNPPFGKDRIQKFVNQAVKCKCPVVMLLPNNFETEYAQYAIQQSDAIYLMGRRPNYIGSDGEYVNNPPVKGAFLLFFNTPEELIMKVAKAFLKTNKVDHGNMTVKKQKLWNHHEGTLLFTL